MILTDELKILDDKIKANQAQDDLDRKAARISVYEYLTGEDLGHKSGVAEREKIEYHPLGMALSKGFKKDDKVNKTVRHDNDLMYNSVHNFNKHSISNFNEISSLDSKFDTLTKFHNAFKKLNDVKSKKK